MSINDLKDRLRDIPGIEGLTMALIAGRQQFGFNGMIAATDPLATDQEIEDAIRNAAQLAAFGRPSQSTPLPTVNLTEPKPMTAPASPTGFVPGEIASLFKNLRDRKTAMVTELMVNGAEFAAILDTGERQAAALKAESEALKAEFGMTTNNPPA